MRILTLLALAACGHAATIKWTRVPAGTVENLTSVACTSAGDVYAIDDAGALHHLRGHAAAPSADPVKVAAAKVKLPGSVDYGRAQIEAVARDGQHVYALGRYMAISNSLENDYAYRSAPMTMARRGPRSGPVRIADRWEWAAARTTTSVPHSP